MRDAHLARPLVVFDPGGMVSVSVGKMRKCIHVADDQLLRLHVLEQFFALLRIKRSRIRMRHIRHDLRPDVANAADEIDRLGKRVLFKRVG
jgi:hypothetical protein